MTDDPKAPERLVSTADDADLRALLDAGRRELPDAEQLESLAAKLGPLLGGPGGPGGGHGGGGGGAAGAVAKTGAASVLAKVLGVAAVAAIVGGTAIHSARGRHAAEDATRTGTTSVAVTTSAALPAPADDTATPAPATSAPARPPTAPARVMSTQAPDDPEAEVALLQRAQGSLEADPAQTLSLCAEHARRFPRGLLAQEREVLAIEALVSTGRIGDARARADRFGAAYPSSTHLRRIHAVLGDPP
jgi:hypothetical protein